MITRIVPMAIPFRSMFVTARHFGRREYLLLWKLNTPHWQERCRPNAQTAENLRDRHTGTHNAPFLFAMKAERRVGRFGLVFLIFVENHSINHHVVPCANVVHPDRSPDFYPRPYDIFIEHLTASRHVSNCLTKMVRPRSAAFLEHDHVARSVLGDRSVALGGGRGCRCL
jgi:hypothetical protein